MSELENDVDVDVTDVTDNTTTTEYSTLTEEQALGWKESLDKAISNHVIPWKEFLKKFGVKSYAELEQKLSQEKDNFISKDVFELERFLDKAPEYGEKREELLETAKALQALPKNKDKTLRELLDVASRTLKVEEEHQASQEKLKKSRVSDWDSFSEITTITRSELEKIALNNPKKYAEISNKMEKGEISFRG